MENSLSPTSRAHWHIVYTHSRTEKTVHTKIKKLGFEALLPVQREVRPWSDRRKVVEVPLFPNYVFVRISPQQRFKLLKIRELVDYVSFDQQPAFVSDEEIESVKRLARHEVNATFETSGSVDERVTITKGPFAGLAGDVLRETGKGDLVVRIHVLRRPLSVEIPKEYVTATFETAQTTPARLVASR